MDPISKVLELPELREKILSFLVFEENSNLDILHIIMLRHVCKTWLESVNQLLYTNTNPRHLRNVFTHWAKYAPIKIEDVTKVQDFVKFAESTQEIWDLAIPVELHIANPRTTSLRDITLEENHAINKLLSNFSQLLIMITIYLPFTLPCNITDFSLPNLKVLTVRVLPKYDPNEFMKHIQNLLDLTQNLHAFKLTIHNQLQQISAEPLRLPNKLCQLSLEAFVRFKYLGRLLLVNKEQLHNLEYLHLTIPPQSKVEPINEILRLCPALKSIRLEKFSYVGIVPLLLEIPETLKELQCFEIGAGIYLKEPDQLSTLDKSKKYPKWKELDLTTDSHEQLQLWITHFSSRTLQRLRVRKEKPDNDARALVGMTITQLQKFYLAYSNITHLDIYLDSQQVLEYIFQAMRNLKGLSVHTNKEVRMNWDAVLVGYSSEQVLRLQNAYKNGIDPISFSPNKQLPSIRNLKGLQALRITAYGYPNYLSEDGPLTDITFYLAFINMRSLKNLELMVSNQISDAIRDAWASQGGTRSIYISQYR